MNHPTTASPSTTPDGAQALRTGLELARASQLTMLRLQLALHKSNRRTAMQALDNLLDMDAEMEGLAATLTGPSPANDADLSGFIGLQKAAIAAEKHALTGGDWRSDTEPTVAATPDDWATGIDTPVQPLLLDDSARVGGGRWMHVLVVAIIIVAIGLGLTAYLWPVAVHDAPARILAFASRAV